LIADIWSRRDISVLQQYTLKYKVGALIVETARSQLTWVPQ